MPVSVPVCSVEKFSCLLQVESQRRERAVVGEALENFGDVGDPEGTLEAGANFMQALRNVQRLSQVLCSRLNPITPIYHGGHRGHGENLKNLASVPLCVLRG